MDIELIYVGNDYYQTTSKVKDDSPSGSDYWRCYIPRVVTRELGLKPERGKIFCLFLQGKPTSRITNSIKGKEERK